MNNFTLSSSFSSSFAKIFISLFSFLFAASANTDDDFLHCLSTHVSNSTSTHEPIFYTPNDSLYYSVLNSSIRNSRLSSPSTPKPSVIVTPFHVSHVQAILYCSKKHGMQIRIRSGGHDSEGLSYVSYFKLPGYAVIDLRNLNSVNVDVESKSAWVQAGATLGELYYWIAEKSGNLGFPAGDCHTVGVGGQIGGGGYGYLSRKYGLAADNILDAKLIDAEGRILDRKSMGEDLFWAIRGGGAASFGIILEWKVRLVPVPSTVTVFDVSRNMENDATKRFVHWWQRRASKVDEDLTIFLTFKTAASSNNDTKIGVEVGVRGTFHGGVDKLLELMEKEFPELGLQRRDCSEMRWVESFLFLNQFRSGESLDVLLDRTSYFDFLPRKVKCDFMKEPIPDDALETILGKLFEEDVGRTVISVFPYGGKMNEISESAIPFPHRAGVLYMVYYTLRWEDQEEEKHVKWLRRFYNDLAPYASKNPRATYVNSRDLDLGTNNLTEGGTTNITQASIWGTKYFKNNFYKLIYVKTKVDPTNFFTYEQSIPPLLTLSKQKVIRDP